MRNHWELLEIKYLRMYFWKFWNLLHHTNEVSTYIIRRRDKPYIYSLQRFLISFSLNKIALKTSYKDTTIWSDRCEEDLRISKYPSWAWFQLILPLFCTLLELQKSTSHVYTSTDQNNQAEQWVKKYWDKGLSQKVFVWPSCFSACSLRSSFHIFLCLRLASSMCPYHLLQLPILLCSHR